MFALQILPFTSSSSSSSSSPFFLVHLSHPPYLCRLLHARFKQPHNPAIMFSETTSFTEEEIKVSFGYKCNGKEGVDKVSVGLETIPGFRLKRTSRSFSCLSGAALSANTTLANTNMCNGLICAEILPSWDSPKSFQRIPSSPSLSTKVEMMSSSLQSTMSNLSCSSFNADESPEDDSYLFKSNFASSPSDGFLNAMEVQVAGGAAGEDRVQAVCSEEDGWLFCAIYDGFNGRDAADFLAGTLYDSILMNLNSDVKQDIVRAPKSLCSNGFVQYGLEDAKISQSIQIPVKKNRKNSREVDHFGSYGSLSEVDSSSDTFRSLVLECLHRALNQAENDFLSMVEQEMDERPDLVSVGSCVLVSLLLGRDLYTMSLGDSRAVLARQGGRDGLVAIQLTDIHSTDNEAERSRVFSEHPEDPSPISAGKVKGKLKVTRAFGVGYLKKKNLNDALMGILRVRNLISPPYVSTNPSINVHRVSEADHFVIVASDGLFDFFTNEEAVELVHCYIQSNPSSDPAKFLLEKLMVRAAECAGFTTEELMNISPPRRRKYHDDVTVIVIMLGSNQRTSRASTFL
ncbi:hypothetical protein V2J09_023228 [Rumex salicifolius]